MGSCHASVDACMLRGSRAAVSYVIKRIRSECLGVGERSSNTQWTCCRFRYLMVYLLTIAARVSA